MAGFLNRLDRRAVSLGKMLEHCGIDPVDFARDRLGQTLLSATRACISCNRGENCALWLDAPADRAHRQPPAFCPNAARLRDTQGASVDADFYPSGPRGSCSCT